MSYIENSYTTNGNDTYIYILNKHEMFWKVWQALRYYKEVSINFKEQILKRQVI